MYEDEKPVEKKAPKDISKMSTDALVKEFIEMDAKLETALNREAATKLKFPEVKKEDEAKAEKDRKEKTKQEQTALRGKLKATPDEYRTQLETEYRRVEKTRDDPESFTAEVDKRKTQLLDGIKRKFATESAELDTKLIKQAYNELGWPQKDAEILSSEEEYKIETTIQKLDAMQKTALEKHGKQVGEEKFSLGIQTIYDQLQHIKNDPDAYKTRLGEVKKQLLESVGEQEQMQTASISTAHNLMRAYNAADALAQTNILWPGSVPDALSLASLPRSNVRGAA